MRKMFKNLTAGALALAGAGAAQAAFDAAQYANGVPQTEGGVTFVLVTTPGQPVTRITNDTRWTANNVYVLDRLTFVEDGATLTIEPGTIVRGEQSTKAGTSVSDPADPGTLLITRGAKIVANGTKESPIVFTSIDDSNVPGGAATIPPVMNGSNLAVYGMPRSYGPVYTDLLGATNTGNNGFAYDAQWGGVIIMGKTRIAQNNITGTDAVVDPTTAGGRNSGTAADFIEGFQTFPTNGVYGGTNDDDDSGVLRFASIRYAGFVLNPGNEINGLTMGGVGRGTCLEFIEIFNNQDDGFEWFGGTVNMKYLASLFNGDDNFDWDEGFRGKGQFWFGIQDNTGNYGTSADDFFFEGDTRTGRDEGDGQGDKLMEMDGGENNAGANEDEGDVARPFSIPKIYNFTSIGRGIDSYATGDNYVRFRGNTGGKWYNGLILDCDTNSVAIRVNGVGTNGVANAAPAATAAAAAFTFQTIDRMAWARPGDGSGGDEFGFLPVVGSNPTEPDLILAGVSFYRAYAETTNTLINSNNRPAIESNLFQVVSRTNTYLVNPGIGGIGRISLDGNNGNLDPRLQAGAYGRGSGVTPPSDGFYVPATFRGAFQDNNWLRGWSVLEWLKVFTNSANADDGPAVSIGFTAGGDPIVSFTAQSGIQYSVEGSQDMKHYRPLSLVTGTGSSVSYTNAGAGSTTNFFRVIPL